MKKTKETTRERDSSTKAPHSPSHVLSLSLSMPLTPSASLKTCEAWKRRGSRSATKPRTAAHAAVAMHLSSLLLWKTKKSPRHVCDNLTSASNDHNPSSTSIRSCTYRVHPAPRTPYALYPPYLSCLTALVASSGSFYRHCDSSFSVTSEKTFAAQCFTISLIQTTLQSLTIFWVWKFFQADPIPLFFSTSTNESYRIFASESAQLSLELTVLPPNFNVAVFSAKQENDGPHESPRSQTHLLIIGAMNYS